METMTKEQSAPAGEIRRSLTDRRALVVGRIMSREVVTAAPDDTISSAADKMTQNHISCVVAVDKTHVIGIFTERDIVRNLDEYGPDLGLMKVSERMSAPVETVQSHVPVLEASRTMESMGIKRLPVVDDQQLIGIVTQTDITRGLILLSPLRSIRDIMSHDVATVDAKATVVEATRIMTQRDISCVVALSDGAPIGVLTEKDLARSVVATRRNPSDVRVSDVMSSPIVEISSTDCIHHASQKMSTLRLHRLVVTEDRRICGIVTQSDIMRAVRVELEQAEADREMVMTTITGRIQSVMTELTQLRDLAHQSSESADGRDTPGNTASGLPWAVEVAARAEHMISELAQL